MNSLKKIIIGCTILHFTSCSDFLDVDIPKDQMSEETVFNDDKTATAATVHLYTMLRSGGFITGNKDGAGYLLACYTDELDVTVTQETSYSLFYNLTVTPNNPALNKIWNASYSQIYRANGILEGLNDSSNVSEELKKQLKGESLAIRALVHFYLTQTFGDVPYITTTDYNVNKKIHKAVTNTVMQKVIDDLKIAEELLSPIYPSTERIRINKSAVQAIMARVYLYQKDWGAAKQYAEKLISNQDFTLEPLDKVFLKQSRSAIWQLRPAADTGNALEGTHYIFTALPAPFAKVAAPLYQSFEKNDLRYLSWIKWIGNGNQAAHPYKYKQRGATTPSQEYSVVLRIEEQYLIAAEASAELKDWSSANNYLSKIRTRAGLDVSQINENTSVSDFILNERKVELFCEYGHRFYDLKRRDKLSDLEIVKAGWQAYFNTLPLPESELSLNSNLLPQNKGY